MANWKVSKEQIKIYPHPNPEVLRLELGACGEYQVVIQKGIYKDGDTIIFVPEKSILPDNIADEGDRRKYLSGPLKNRVKSVKLQKELSQGLILPDRPEFANFPIGDDISEQLCISRYEPPIPAQLAGMVKVLDTGADLSRHDVQQFNIKADEFVDGEEILAFEKVHGSQAAIIRLANGERIITSKGLFGKGLRIEDSDSNSYWNASKNAKIWEILDKEFPNKLCQVFGELVPCQSGYTYGFVQPTILVFRVEVDGQQLAFDAVPDSLKAIWVPLLYRGAFDREILFKLRSGKETVSGKSLSIREGIVISPIVPRLSSGKGSNSFPLYLKLINPEYKDDEEAVN